MRDRLSPFAVIWQRPDYRAFLLVMVLASLGVSASMPLISLYLVNHIHVALPGVGLFFASEALPGFVAGMLLGRLSDRRLSRLPILRGAIAWVALGWLVFALSPFRPLTLAVGAAFFSAGLTVMGQVFAAVHDVMSRDGESRPELINTAIRTGFSLGFVVGPLLGTGLAALISFRAAFLTTAAIWVLCLLPLRGLDVAVGSVHDREEERGPAGSARLLYVFTGLCVLVMCGTGIKNTYLPIDVTTHLGGSLSLYGTILTVSPIVELVAMPMAGVLALRFPLGRLIALGLAVAIVEYLILALSAALWQLYVTQAMDALVIAVVSGLGMTYAQRLSPGRPGLASGVFGSVYGVAVVAGNLLGSAAVPFLGIPHIFFTPVALCAIALLTFAGVERAARQEQGHGASFRRPASDAAQFER